VKKIVLVVGLMIIALSGCAKQEKVESLRYKEANVVFLRKVKPIIEEIENLVLKGHPEIRGVKIRMESEVYRDQVGKIRCEVEIIPLEKIKEDK